VPKGYDIPMLPYFMQRVDQDLLEYGGIASIQQIVGYSRRYRYDGLLVVVTAFGLR
jgi:hypothetical protein